MDLAHDFVAPGTADVGTLLQDWRWLIGEARYTLHRATAMGSLFLRDEQGAIHFLDTTDAAFDRVAGSPEELDRLLDDRHERRDLLGSFLVRELRDMGVGLGPGQCYSWKVPPALGGEGDPGNIEPADLLVHLSVMGQLHRRIKDLPPGTPIVEIIVAGPDV